MSETQFSSLSPNSSNDLDTGNYYSVDNDLFDQETLSVTSDKSVANLDDFNDPNYFKLDPFLSDIMKDENDDMIMFPPWLQDIDTESNEMNVFFSSLSTENDLNEYLSVNENCLEAESTDLLNWDDAPTNNQTSAQKSICIKRSMSPVGEKELSSESALPIKQRRVEVSSHVRCDEWINKYHDMPEKCSLKDSGMIDRRKTKHHKVLSEYDTELQIENIDLKRNRVSLLEPKKLSTFPQPPIKSIYHNNHPPTSNPAFQNKCSDLRIVNGTTEMKREPFVQYNCSKPDPKSHITSRSPKDVHALPAAGPDDFTSNRKLSIYSDVVEMSRIPMPLRMGKKVNRRGHRLSLWQYLLCLLDCNKYKEYTTGIKWINRTNGVFHIIDSKQVATLWGQYKERREKMTYDSLARSLRHYYKKNLMAKINNRRLVYQIAQECLQWSSECFLRKSRD